MPSQSTLDHFVEGRRPAEPVDLDPGATRWESVHRRARPWDVPALPTLVVAPHPDDESLTVGGLIARQTNRNVPVTVLAVTDGESAFPGRDLEFDLRSVRMAEQHQALQSLGVDPSRIHRMSIPDGAVADHERTLASAISEMLEGVGLMVSPWELDWHPDHEACGRAAAAASAGRPVILAHSVFWGWHHRPDASFAGTDLVAIGLDDREFMARSTAVACHVSQVADDLTQRLLDDADTEPTRWMREFYVMGRS